ncbi:MAG: hypothetical protein JWM12_2834, partial [Ilumatobacteraceae bacterium]|nr:hypothetical protein [Ilumatobacteraceae bacterium]
MWSAAAIALIIAGSGAAFVIARSVAEHDAGRSRATFEQSSASIAASLRVAVQREEDLVVSATGFFVASPDATDAQFHAWSSSVQALVRYPELLGWAEVVIVPKSQLAAFSEQASTDPSRDSSTSGPIAVVPPGDRPYYCLARSGQNRNESAQVPAGFDYCAGADGAVTAGLRDSGMTAYRAVDTGNGAGPRLAVQVPFYRGGAAPVGLAARRGAFVGWMGMAFDPKQMLERAMDGAHDMSVVFRYHDESSDAEFSAGRRPASAATSTATATIDLRNGWTVETSAPVTGDGVLANGVALGLLLAGCAASVLLAALVLLLGTGRKRALRLVDDRTVELRHQALHDALTGLPNRALLMDRIDHLLARNRRRGTVGAALFIDLDDFKNVNDTLGHAAGDRLLVAVAERLTSTLLDADTISRMGGDEFVVLLDGTTGDIAPTLVAERLLSVLSHPFELEGAPTPLVIHLSIGIAIGDRAIAGDLLRDADVALYEAKAAGKNGYELFRPEMHTEVMRRVELEFDLRSAFLAGHLHLAYQPIYHLDDLGLVGVEALLRWDHPTLGAVAPEEFVPILEQTGMIHDVGRWVLRTACRQMATWHERGDTLELSVNVSGRQLDLDSIVDDIRDALDVTGLDPGTLIIEVTETALMRNTTDTARRLRAVKELGVRIAIDDFGT